MLTVSAAAAELGVSERRIRAMCATGRLPATRFGKRNWLILSVDAARIRPPGRPKAKIPETIPASEVVTGQVLPATPKRKRKKLAKPA